MTLLGNVAESKILHGDPMQVIGISHEIAVYKTPDGLVFFVGNKQFTKEELDAWLKTL